MTDSSRTRLSYITESTYGTTPSTPTFLNQRFVSENLNANIQNVVSNEIRSDRNVTDLIQVGQSAGGTVNFELTYGSFDTWFESVMFGAWSSDVLKNGTTQKAFSLEKTFEAGATDQYHRFVGSVADSMALSVQAGQIVTGSFGFLSKTMTTGQAIISGATYTAANTNPVMNAASNFGSLAVTGASGIELTSLNLNISNNLRQQQVIGSIASRGISTGRFELTGELTAYFVDEALYNLFLNATGADLTFTLTDSLTNAYTFEVGALKFESGEVVAGGNDQDVMAKMVFRGLFDTDNTLKITRNPA